jgi:F0F1-type ATP synthase assembly protein I
MNDATPVPSARPRHIWPWFVVAFVILGVVLCVLAIRGEAQRVREQRQFEIPAQGQ